MDKKKLYKSESDKRISGVCGGIAQYLNIDSTVVRLLYVLFTFFGAGTGLVVYFLAALIMPDESEVKDGFTKEVKKDSINPDDII